MAKYKVLSRLSHSGNIYGIGSIADLEEGTFQVSLIGEVLELIPEPLPIEINEEVPNNSKKKAAKAAETAQETATEETPTA